MLEISYAAESAARTAGALMSEGFTVYDALAAISGGIGFDTSSVHEDCLEESRDKLLSLSSIMAEADKACFSALFCQFLEKEDIGFSEDAFLSCADIPESFIYVRNAFSDEAYDVFSQDFTDPKVKYARDFRECIGAVAGGECGYCLLPLEERGGARLHGVCELIYSSDLRICAVTPVFGPGADADLKYCLVSSGYMLSQRKEGDDRYLELRLGADGSYALSTLLTVAGYFGHTVYRVNTMSFASGEVPRSCYSVVIRDEQKDFAPLLTYLSLFAEDVTFVGVYKNLE